MNKKKIINDPVYGFVSIPFEFLFDIIEHPFFQRLRRIQQLGLTHYVYPGALHTRFHHALGATHLMGQAIKVLRSKNIDITKEEAEAVTIAILLHDIGHGPFSHALEHRIVPVHHETLSILFMEELNRQFDGKLNMAISIFKNEYPKKFLHQLVSSQLDMDRMDYLNRDSYFTGVSEGVIGYDRIIKMLNVRNDELVVEEKGIYSIEKFLISRRIMYWQVYLHRTVLCAEQMLIQAVKRITTLVKAGEDLPISNRLKWFLNLKSVNDKQGLLQNFSTLDDFDIITSLKNLTETDDFVLKYYARSIINRRLFRIELQNKPFDCDFISKVRQKVKHQEKVTDSMLDDLVFTGSESNSAYKTQKEEIKILLKNGNVIPFSQTLEYHIESKEIRKYYLCYPK